MRNAKLYLTREAHIAGTERSVVNPTPSAILRFRAGSYEWPAMEEPEEVENASAAEASS